MEGRTFKKILLSMFIAPSMPQLSYPSTLPEHDGYVSQEGWMYNQNAALGSPLNRS